eukprot:6912397-Prymnesium_polylepis.4
MCRRGTSNTKDRHSEEDNERCEPTEEEVAHHVVAYKTSRRYDPVCPVQIAQEAQNLGPPVRTGSGRWSTTLE